MMDREGARGAAPSMAGPHVEGNPAEASVNGCEDARSPSPSTAESHEEGWPAQPAAPAAPAAGADAAVSAPARVAPCDADRPAQALAGAAQAAPAAPARAASASEPARALSDAARALLHREGRPARPTIAPPAAAASAAAAFGGVLYPPAERSQIRDSWRHLMRWSRRWRTCDDAACVLDNLEKARPRPPRLSKQRSLQPAGAALRATSPQLCARCVPERWPCMLQLPEGILLRCLALRACGCAERGGQV